MYDDENRSEKALGYPTFKRITHDDASGGKLPAVAQQLDLLDGEINLLDENLSRLINKLGPVLNHSLLVAEDPDETSDLKPQCEVANRIESSGMRLVKMSKIIGHTINSLEI